jgi:hypothetical protein
MVVIMRDFCTVIVTMLAFILSVDMRVDVCMSVLVGMDYTVMAMFMGV